MGGWEGGGGCARGRDFIDKAGWREGGEEERGKGRRRRRLGGSGPCFSLLSFREASCRFPLRSSSSLSPTPAETERREASKQKREAIENEEE